MTDKVVGTGMLSFITLGGAAAEDAPKANEEYKSPLTDEEHVETSAPKQQQPTGSRAPAEAPQ